MCRGREVPGSKTRSRGNNGRSATESPNRERANKLQDCNAPAEFPLRALTCYVAENTNANMELAGKVAVVTGASMGIGEAIAKVFAQEGASVVMLSRDAARAEAARTRIA